MPAVEDKPPFLPPALVSNRSHTDSVIYEDEIINSPQLTILEISTSNPTRINSNHVAPVENGNILHIEASGENSTQDANLLADYPAYSGYFEANRSYTDLYLPSIILILRRSLLVIFNTNCAFIFQ